MTGQQLYEMWAAAALENGLECDAWDEIEDVYKYAWDDLAANLNDRKS